MVVNLLRMLLFDDKPLKAQCRISVTVLAFPVTALGASEGMTICHFVCLCRLSNTIATHGQYWRLKARGKEKGKKTETNKQTKPQPKPEAEELRETEDEKSSKLLWWRGGTTNEWPPSLGKECLHFISTLIWAGRRSARMMCKQQMWL